MSNFQISVNLKYTTEKGGLNYKGSRKNILFICLIMALNLTNHFNLPVKLLNILSQFFSEYTKPQFKVNASINNPILVEH